MNDMQSKAGEALTYGGSATSVVAGLSLNEIGLFVGIITALAGVAIQIYFGRKRDKREKRIHELELQRLAGDFDDD
jgi:hypothetical protein